MKKSLIAYVSLLFLTSSLSYAQSVTSAPITTSQFLYLDATGKVRSIPVTMNATAQSLVNVGNSTSSSLVVGDLSNAVILNATNTPITLKDAYVNLTSGLTNEISRAKIAEQINTAGLATLSSRVSALPSFSVNLPNGVAGLDASASITVAVKGSIDRAIYAGSPLSQTLSTMQTTESTLTNTTQSLTNSLAKETARAISAEAQFISNNSPQFSGTPTTPTAIAGTNSNIIASTQYVDRATTNETSRATNAEATLTADLAAEQTRAQNAESTTATAVATEKTRATSSEALLSTNLTTESSRAQNAESTNANAITSETTRATGVEQSISTSLTNGLSQAQTANATNATNITNETTRAQTAEQTTASGLSNEVIRAKAAEASAQSTASAAQSAANAAQTASANAIPNTKIGVPNGVASLNASGQITAPFAGDTSSATTLASAPQATNLMANATRASLTSTVADYLTSASGTPSIGQGFSLNILKPQAANDTSVTVRSTVGLTNGVYVTSPYLPTGTTITNVGGGTSTTTSCTTTTNVLTVAHQIAQVPNMTGSSNGLICSGIIGAPAGATVTDSNDNTIGTIQIVTYPSLSTTELWLTQDVNNDIPSNTSLKINYTAVTLTLSAGWTQAITPANGAVGLTTQDDSQAFTNAAFYSQPSMGGHGGLLSIPGGAYYKSNFTYVPQGTGLEWTNGLSFLPGSQGDETNPGVSYMTSGYGKSFSFKDNSNSGGVLALYDELYQTQQAVTQGQALLIKQINVGRTNDGGAWGPGMVGQDIQQSIASNITNGVMWGYHETDGLSPGQLVSWAGAEIELYNTSGFWGAYGGSPLGGNKTGLHIDNIGSGPALTPINVAFEADGPWHNMSVCPSTVSEWCMVTTNNNYNDFGTTPIGGLDSHGRILATSLSIGQPVIGPTLYTQNSNLVQNVLTPDTKTLALNNSGELGAAVVNTPSLSNYTASVASVTIENGGMSNAPVTLSIGAPPTGGTQATATVTSYTLGAVQGAVQFTTSLSLSSGTVFNVGSSAQCTDVPQVKWDGTEFVVSHPGLCQTLPAAITYDQNGRAILSIADAATGKIKPSIEPLWSIASISVSGGSGYNHGVAPTVLPTTLNVASNTIIGHIYTPPHLLAVMGSAVATPVNFATGVTGDTSNASVTTSALGGTTGIPLAVRNSDKLTVRDYAKARPALTAGGPLIAAGQVGGASTTTLISASTTTSNSNTYATAVVPSTTQVSVYEGVVISNLPNVTTVTAITPNPTPTTLNLTAYDQTTALASETLLVNQYGMPNEIRVNGYVNIPLKSSISGSNIPSGTTVVKTTFDGSKTHIYMSNQVTANITAGTAITVSYSTETLTMSNNWTSVPSAWSTISFYTQDDYASFINGAVYNPTGAHIYVPSGQYYLSNQVYSRRNTVFDLGPNVTFVPGSASIEGTDGSFPTYSQSTLLGIGADDNQTPVVLNIAQTVYQRTVPDLQGQALLIAQQDACQNDGGSWGCGIVAQEIKQSANPNIRRGAMWMLHGTDYILPGQAMSWAGAELEVANSSGFWGAWTGNSLQGNRIGLHIDNIVPTDPSHVANSYVLDPAGDWHTLARCSSDILDWCFSHTTQKSINQQPQVDAGLDSKGRVFGQNIITSQMAPDTTGTGIGVISAATRTAEMNNDGSVGSIILNTPSIVNQTGSVSAINIEDGGRFNGQVTISIAPPPQGGTQATAYASTYALKAVQGAAAINANYQANSNAPVGVTDGMIFALPNGNCSVQPRVQFSASANVWTVVTPGVCTASSRTATKVLPYDNTNTLPEGMIRDQLQLTYVSGGSGAPATLPVIEPLYTVTAVTVDNPGSGYNFAVPPEVLGETTFVPANNDWIGIIYTPIKLTSTLGSPSTAPVTFTSGVTGDVSTAYTALNNGHHSNTHMNLITQSKDQNSIRSYAGNTTTGNVGNAFNVTTTVDNPSGSTTFTIPISAGNPTNAKFIGTELVSGGVINVSAQAPDSDGTNYYIHLASATTVDIPAGTEVSIIFQDDFLAFWAAGQDADSTQSGTTQNQLLIPPGIYYLGQGLGVPDGLILVSHGGVKLAHGSNGTTANGLFNGGSSVVFDQHSVQQTADTLILNQLVDSPAGKQVNTLLINDVLNTGVIDPNNPFNLGGSVGIEIQQSVNPTMTRGLLFSYHAVQNWSQNQIGTASLAELEYNDNSGNDVSYINQVNSKYGLHLDVIGNTGQSAAIKFASTGQSASGGGYWHVGMACEGMTIKDWCVAHYRDSAPTDDLSDIDAGMDTKGAFLTPQLTVASQNALLYNQTSPRTNQIVLNTNGSIGATTLNAQSLSNTTSSVSSISVTDGGAYNSDALVEVAAPASGTAATASVSSYAFKIVRGLSALTGSPQGSHTYNVSGGTCSTQPQVQLQDGGFVTTTPGVCTAPPYKTPVAVARSTSYAINTPVIDPNGNEAIVITAGKTASSAPSYTKTQNGITTDGTAKLQTVFLGETFHNIAVLTNTDGSATNVTIEPVYKVLAVSVTNAGSGYNSAIPPAMIVRPSYNTTTSTFNGYAYDQAKLAVTLGNPVTNAISTTGLSNVGAIASALDNQFNSTIMGKQADIKAASYGIYTTFMNSIYGLDAAGKNVMTLNADETALPNTNNVLADLYLPAYGLWTRFINIDPGTPVSLSTLSSATQTLTFDANGNNIAVDITPSQNTTLSLTGGYNGRLQTIRLIIRQPSSTGYTVTLPSNVKWQGGIAPQVSTNPGDFTLITFMTDDGGATYFGSTN